VLRSAAHRGDPQQILGRPTFQRAALFSKRPHDSRPTGSCSPDFASARTSYSPWRPVHNTDWRTDASRPIGARRASANVTHATTARRSMLSHGLGVIELCGRRGLLIVTRAG
jgi:hypothetical protein